MKKALTVIGIGWLGLALTVTTVFAASEKPASDLQSKHGDDSTDVIVQFQTVPSEAHHRRVRKLGGALQDRMDFIKAAHYRIPASALKDLAADPDVVFITPNRPLHAMMDVPAQTVNAAAAVAAGYTGAGIGAALIDSGIASLPSDFQRGWTSSIVYAADLTGISAPDQYGHGSHVAGLIASSATVPFIPVSFRKPV